MKSVIYTLSLLFLFSCQQQSKVESLDKEKISKEVSEMFAQYYQAVSENGLTAEFEYLDTSEDFFWVPPGYSMPLDYDSVKAIVNKNAELFGSVKFENDTLHVIPLTNEIANYTGVFKGVMTEKTGIVSKVKFIESGTVIKRADGWKRLSGQSEILNIKSEVLE